MRRRTEANVNLNVHEIGVIMSALQLLENVDENRIAKECGSADALYGRLNALWKQMDTSEIGLRNDIVPSY